MKTEISVKKKNKNKLSIVPKQKLGLTIAVIILLLLMLFFSRFGILKYYIHRNINHFNRNTHAELRIGKISFSGLSSIYFNNLLIVSKNNQDSLLAVDSANIKISILPLFTGNISVNNFSAQNIKLHLIDNENYSNFLFLFNRPKEKPDESHERNYAKQINKLFQAFFYRIPTHIEINNIFVLAEKNENKRRFHTDKLELINNRFDAVFDVTDQGKKEILSVNGNINPSLNQLSIQLYSPLKGFVLHNIQVPTSNIVLQLFSFDTLNLQIINKIISKDELNLSGLFSVSNLTINNPKFARNDIGLAKAGLKFNINIGSDYFEMDSSTVVTTNKLSFNLYIKFVNRENQSTNNYKGELILNKEKFTAQDLFESLPSGMFSILEGIKTKGELEYHLRFRVDLSNPDSLKFTSNLKKHNFGIVAFGKTNLAKLNSSFAYTAYDKDIPVRTFAVGPENNDYVPLKNISHFLVQSILISEDGGFYINRGFNEDSFRESIIKNIKEKRFARGGSTISMQLVKNVFLNRNKNIGRKLEEVLLVWLIENNNLCSKDRMMEVYLNIIEWGPRIYGIGEASKFYFDKKPANLTLAESIYLASIIPHPKRYKYSFDEHGELKENLKGFYKLVSEKMLRKEYITQADADNLKPFVKLKGPSLRMLLKDTLGKRVNIDSLFQHTEDE